MPPILTEDVNHYKDVYDIAPTTLDKRERFYVNVRGDEIEDLNSRHYVSIQAKWTWLRLKMLMTRTAQPGILIENGQPIPIETLAVILNRRPSSIKNLHKEITELLNARVLRIHEGFIYDYVLLVDEWNRFSGNLRRNGEVSESFEEVFKRFPLLFKNSPLETSVSNSNRSSSRNNMTTTATVTDSTDNGRDIPGSPNGAAESALPTEFENLRSEFNHDLDADFLKWKETFPGQKPTIGRLRGFFGKFKPTKTKKPAAKPTTKPAEKPETPKTLAKDYFKLSSEEKEELQEFLDKRLCRINHAEFDVFSKLADNGPMDHQQLAEFASTLSGFKEWTKEDISYNYLLGDAMESNVIRYTDYEWEPDMEGWEPKGDRIQITDEARKIIEKFDKEEMGYRYR